MASQPTGVAVLSALLRFVAKRVLVFVAFLATLSVSYMVLFAL